ncbi:hypothetical protein DY000_02016076 [Brassica cretica]|uniref:CCHC-type domain-containing protein n=1 Tax=Brassica cretica TaxID=69181 RepID=A0ABQ7DBX0_BRACR|nr:hypothetical protein DY000_02016076 [Brassica cretica]
MADFFLADLQSGEDEAHSGAPYRYGEEEVQSGMFDEISEDGNCFGSTSGSSGFDSKMSLDGEAEDDKMVGDSIDSRYLSALERAMGKQPHMKKMKTEKVNTEQQPQKWRKLYTCSNCKQGGHNRATCKGG